MRTTMIGVGDIGPRPSVALFNRIGAPRAMSARGYKRLTKRADAELDPVLKVERDILLDAHAMLNDLTRTLDAKVAALVAERLTPLDAEEARYFMRDFERGNLLP